MSDPVPPPVPPHDPSRGTPGYPPQPAPGSGAPGYPPPAAPAYGTPGYPPPAAPAYGAPAAPAQPQYPAPPSYGAPDYPPQPQYGAPGYPPQYGASEHPGQGYGYAQPAHPGAYPPAPTVVRPLRTIGAATRWLLLVSAALGVVTILIEAWGIASLNAYSTGSVGISALNSYDALSGLVSVVALVVMLAAGICWVVWQHRAASSLPAGSLRRSPGWHVGSWFIPVIAFWFPFQNISDLARVSRAALSTGTRGAWWTLWIAAGVASGIASNVLRKTETLSSLMSALTVTILSDALMIAAALLAWIIVARITDAIDPRTR